jgi:hypothetical protein
MGARTFRTSQVDDEKKALMIHQTSPASPLQHIEKTLFCRGEAGAESSITRIWLAKDFPNEPFFALNLKLSPFTAVL